MNNKNVLREIMGKDLWTSGNLDRDGTWWNLGSNMSVVISRGIVIIYDYGSYGKGVSDEDSYFEVNLSDPELVVKVRKIVGGKS